MAIYIKPDDDTPQLIFPDIYGAMNTTQGKGMSKTNAIFEFMNQNQKDNEIHVVVTNNSLEEVEQFFIRACNKYFNPKTISSNKKISGSITFEKLMLQYTTARKHTDIPNVIIICNNHTQCKQLKTYMEYVTENVNTRIGGITFRLYFDEVDTNTRHTCKMIHSLRDYFPKIMSIVLITATMYYETMRALEKSLGILEFCIKNLYRELTEYTDEERKKDVDGYRRLSHHETCFIDDTYFDEDKKCDAKMDEVQYTQHVLETKPELFTTERVCGIVLGGREKTTHNDIKNMFLNINFIVIVLNSDIRGGTIHFPPTDACPDGKCVSFTKIKEKIFKKKKVQMYEILAKLYSMYPDKSFVITGNIKIQRGVTFVSTGSKLHFMIMSSNGKSSTKRQFSGRFTGDEEYVDVSLIICPETTHKEMLELEELSIKTHLQNPELLTPKHCDVKNYEHGRRLRTYNPHVKIFPTQEQALQFGVDVLNYKFRYRPTDIASVTLQNSKTGENPTALYLRKRCYGLSNKRPFRMTPIDTGEWTILMRFPIHYDGYEAEKTFTDEEMYDIIRIPDKVEEVDDDEED